MPFHLAMNIDKAMDSAAAQNNGPPEIFFFGYHCLGFESWEICFDKFQATYFRPDLDVTSNEWNPGNVLPKMPWPDHSLGGGFKCFLFSTPTWGRFPNLTNIFQRGWNHQLDSGLGIIIL